jgi:DNA polymerase V
MNKVAAIKKPLDGAIPLQPGFADTVKRPLFHVPAGYPSAAQDYMEQELDIVDYLMGQRRASIFLFRLQGDSMKEAGIMHNDVIIVDKAIDPVDGHIVVACVSGEFTCKYYRKNKSGVWLVAANPDFKPIKVTEEMDFTIFGVVESVMRNRLPRATKPFKVPVVE